MSKTSQLYPNFDFLKIGTSLEEKIAAIESQVLLRNIVVFPAKYNGMFFTSCVLRVKGYLFDCTYIYLMYHIQMKKAIIYSLFVCLFGWGVGVRSLEV